MPSLNSIFCSEGFGKLCKFLDESGPKKVRIKVQKWFAGAVFRKVIFFTCSSPFLGSHEILIYCCGPGKNWMIESSSTWNFRSILLSKFREISNIRFRFLVTRKWTFRYFSRKSGEGMKKFRIWILLKGSTNLYAKGKENEN